MAQRRLPTLSLRLVLAFGLVFPAVSPPALAASSSGPAAADCPFLDDLDAARFELDPTILPKADVQARDFIRRTRIDLRAPHGYRAGRVVVVQSQGYKSAPAVLAAFRSPDGQWLLRTVWPQFSWRSGRELSPGLAARLNAALADACLARDPPVAPRRWPIRGGKMIVCADGADTWFDLDLPPAAPERRFHECGPRGAIAEVKSILIEAVFGPED